MLRAEKITVRFGSFTAVQDVSFALEAGQWLMLAGPNGAGKSTLISVVAQMTPYTGRVLVQGMDAARLRPRDLARRMGVLAQHHSVGYDYTVEEIVSLGRYAHRSAFGTDPGGRAAVARALALTGMEPLRAHRVCSLSGGELQRAFLAQVFAQEPQILLLDEPANHLDLGYQKQIFSLIEAWLQLPGRAVISVVHDLSLARRYGTHALLMQQGQCIASGAAQAVFTPENLSRVYGMDVYAWMREILSQWQA